jgi:tripartite motif-containing protein 71
MRYVVDRPTRPAGLLALCLLLGMLEGCGHHVGRGGGSGRHGAATDAVREPSRTVGEFGRSGTARGEFKEPFGIAVERRRGDVYVVDTENSRIEKFTSAGRFLLAWGWGVADGRTRALQTCTTRCFAGLRGEGAGQFHFAEGIAVDNDPSSRSYGDVYVVDLGNLRVQKFNPRGGFLLTFGGGVNQTAHKHHDHAEEDVCPVKPGDICEKGAEGPAGGQMELTVEGSFIAVARNGTVYVGQRNRVKAFSPEGAYESQIKLSPAPKSTEGHEVGGVSGLAINASGDLYVIRNGIVGVNEYAPSGKLVRTLDEQGGEPSYPEGPTPSLALDPVGDVFIDVYANYVHRIDEYSSSGVKISSFDEGKRALPGIADKEDGLPGMAYDPRTQKLYLVNADVNVRPVVERVRIVMPP